MVQIADSCSGLWNSNVRVYSLVLLLLHDTIHDHLCARLRLPLKFKLIEYMTHAIIELCDDPALPSFLSHTRSIGHPFRSMSGIQCERPFILRNL